MDFNVVADQSTLPVNSDKNLSVYNRYSVIAVSSQRCREDDGSSLSLRISLRETIGLYDGQKASWTLEMCLVANSALHS